MAIQEIGEVYPFQDRKVPLCSTCRASIIVPTKNASQSIGTTIESILQQRNVRFEAIFIDAESKDRTVEIIRSFEDPRIRVQVVPSSKVFEMINRGIVMAQGDYIQVLRPGDSYLYPDALALAVWQIAQNDFPDLFYCACILRDEWYQSHFLFRPFMKELLRSGMQPTNLQSCFIKRSVFKKVGYFDTTLEEKGALDFFIRFLEHPELSSQSEMRVYIDSAITEESTASLLKNFSETFSLIRRHFGLPFALMWLGKQKDIRRLILRSFRHLKQSFQST
jgi:glycosyltransferase involved in cell wall biosynthesis